MSSDQKQLPAPPRVTGVVVRSEHWEATISDGKMTLSKLGPKGGRTKELTLDTPDADDLLAVVGEGRRVLTEMAGAR